MRIIYLLIVSAVLATGAITAGCTGAADEHEVTPALKQVLDGQPIPPVEPAVWTDLRAFYTQRADRPAWVNSRRPTENAADALNALNTARQHGFDANDYGAGELLALSQAVEDIDRKSPERLQRVAEFDVRMTAALFAFGRDVAMGRTTPKSPDGSWKAHRTAPDYAGTFSQALDDPLKWIESLRPPHPEYAALQKALDDLHGQKEKGGWSSVPALKPGASGAAIVALRQRLAAGGHLEAPTEPSSQVDGELEAAVKAFQNLHGIKATGVVDKATLVALNVPLDRRMRQVALNLQRWRWIPDDLGEQHIMVNVPQFTMVARENGKTVMDIRVVVGTPANKTPIFSDEMETVVLSPYWNIPDSIAEGETVPAIARDPGYLERQNIEVLRRSGDGVTAVKASDVNWDDEGSLEGLVFRQRPGARNALGHVKFLFPNSYNVYLHDTPADDLFARPGRAFSHGCVRVEEPEKLAKYVLRDFPEWDEPTLFAAMQSGVEKHVKLKEKIPVHLVYFTSWVNENGGLHFQPDVYGYDRVTETPSTQR
ncbi:MAG: L,D-transpeptidase family protein [Acidobacteriota bacterium]|nr:L,D-transpeptidase family protein [Acidobacteriota bacterium]